jgi:uncharacterized protein YbjT (DUF2867 family)
MCGAGPALADGVLVFGGTGQLGARIVRLLVEAGEDVTVFARPTSDRSRLDGLEVRYAIGDMLDEDSLAAAFSSARYRAVVYAARAPISEVPFYDLTSGYIASYAKATGVGQIIHHGAVGAGENMADFPDLPWDAVPGLTARMEDHGAAERNYFESGVNTTILRNSRVWPDDTPGTGKAELTEDQSTMTPTTRADLAVLTMRCLDNPACANRIYHVRDETLSWPPPGREE